MCPLRRNVCPRRRRAGEGNAGRVARRPAAVAGRLGTSPLRGEPDLSPPRTCGPRRYGAHWVLRPLGGPTHADGRTATMNDTTGQTAGLRWCVTRDLPELVEIERASFASPWG